MTFSDEQRAEFTRQLREQRVADFRARRPVRLRDAGTLHAEVAAWGKQLIDGGHGNLVIVGPPGTGKTWSVWEVLQKAVEAGFARGVTFVDSAAWMRVVTPPVDLQRLETMRTAGVLVLDDLGMARVSDWHRECLMSLVDPRWQDGLPTVVTTNLEGDLEDALGGRLASRLADDATVVALDGDDLRGRS